MNKKDSLRELRKLLFNCRGRLSQAIMANDRYMIRKLSPRVEALKYAIEKVEQVDETIEEGDWV